MFCRASACQLIVDETPPRPASSVRTRLLSGPYNLPMKKSLIWITSLVAIFCGNLTVTAQSISPATKEIPLTSQNAVLPRTRSGESAEMVNRPDSQSNSQSTLEIPQALKGCWEVTIDGPPDSFQYIKGPQIAGWARIKKTLCFIETTSHSFQITYQTANLDLADAESRGPVSDFQSHTEVIGSDDKGTFTLRGVTTHRESLGWFWGQIEYTTISLLECKFTAEELVVQASSFSSCTGAPRAGCDGGPTSTSKGHLIFHRAPNTP